MKPGIALSLLALILPATSSLQAASADRPAELVFGGKPLAPIAIHFEIDRPPAVGQLVEIRLEITPSLDLSNGVLTLGVDDPLALIEPAAEIALGEIAAGEPASFDVTVLPLIDQTHYLDVVVRGEIGGQQQVRAIAIAIRLPGGESLKSAEPAPAQRTATDAVHSLPAVETVY